MIADAELLKLVIQNLLLNAVHAISGRGHDPRHRELDGRCRITVTDNGPGIPPRSGKSSSRRFSRQGSWYGPRAVHGQALLEAQGGTIAIVCPATGRDRRSASSCRGPARTPRRRFLNNLARNRADRVALPGVFPPHMPNSPPAPRVLVVDDELLIRWSLGEALTAAGYIVVEGRDAAEARRAIGDHVHPPDIVVLDYRLPDSDDLGLLTAIRRAAPTVPVILMTAHGTAEVVHGALDLAPTALSASHSRSTTWRRSSPKRSPPAYRFPVAPVGPRFDAPTADAQVFAQNLTTTAERPRDFPAAAKKPAPPRILVVDDERLVRWSVAETLTARGSRSWKPRTPDRRCKSSVTADHRTGAAGSAPARCRRPACAGAYAAEGAGNAGASDDRLCHARDPRGGGGPRRAVIAKPFDLNDLAAHVERVLAGRVY